MNEPVPMCYRCKHYRGVVKCAAFPAGIPDEIFFKDFDHTEPFTRDHGTFFDLKKPQEE